MRLKLFIMLLLAAAIPAIAQDSGVRGAVVDADSGMPVVGATVLLNQGASAVTGLNGDFQITNASPGDETLTVIAYGYNDIVKDVTLFAKQTVDLGQLKMTPEVSSNAGNVVILDDNQLEDKHVESVFVPRLDESSNLSISTRKNEEVVVSTQPPHFFLDL